MIMIRLRGKTRRLVPTRKQPWNLDCYAPAWSPNGKLIAFSVGRAYPPDDACVPVFNLGVVQPDGNRFRRLTRGRNDFLGPVCSPDSRRIAASPLRGTGIYAISARGGRVRTLVKPGHDPAWSPDGRSIAFRIDEPGGGGAIVVAAANGGDRRRVSLPRSLDFQPAWSRDSTRLTFVVRYSIERTPWRTQGDVWVMNADGTGRRQLTSGVADDQWPAWLPSLR